MKNIIAVASGKGGVGKSTIAVNLSVALALRQEKPRVALIDLDFYGPSIPLFMGGGEITTTSEGRLEPAVRYGVKFVSIAFFLKNDDDAVIWRGPMFTKAISQLFEEVSWGDVDYCIVDLPPGTGDAQLSLAQQVQLDGAIVVTTPQQAAVKDVQRAITMLRKVNVPVLGIVENMAGFIAADGNRYDIFGTGGADQLARRYELPLLISIPLDAQIARDSDDGRPPASCEGTSVCAAFADLAEKTIRQLGKRRRPGERLKVVS